MDHDLYGDYLAPYTGAGAETAFTQVRNIIEYRLSHSPRSLQRRIGPSELGTPCDHCLAAKLAGWEEHTGSPSWYPGVGTAVHAMFSDLLIQEVITRRATDGTGAEWLSEQTVTVGRVGGVPITGSCDLYHVPTGTVIDFKVVGPTTITAARTSGPSETYQAQIDLYGTGWLNQGMPVTEVGIWYVPRNAPTLARGHVYHRPHDPDHAQRVLDRADRLAQQASTLAQVVGEQARDAWISQLPRADGCRSCERYPDYTPALDQITA